MKLRLLAAFMVGTLIGAPMRVGYIIAGTGLGILVGHYAWR